MFEARQSRTTLGHVLGLFEVTFHAAVRKVRQGHGNAVIAILSTMAQNVLMIAGFYALFSFLGRGSGMIRGNFVMFLMSGIMMFLMHVQTMRAVMGSDGATSPMMLHAPMNTMVSILAGALSELYTKTISFTVLVLAVHVLIEPVAIDNWFGTMMMFLLVWFTGVAFGLLFMGLKPWIPDVVSGLSQVYMRGNMIFSGKMFTANSMPAIILPVFIWNPLFHIIDQMRGFIFVNYTPKVTSPWYPFYVAIAVLVVALLLEHYTRRHASLSWDAKR